MPWFIVQYARDQRLICPVAHDDRLEAEMHAAILNFADQSDRNRFTVEELDDPGFVPVPMAFEAKRRKGK